jgi:hypothetical protein
MNLPTREEAKGVGCVIEARKNSLEKIINQFGRKAKLYDEYIKDIKAYSIAVNVLQALSSGTLIEARTEGEIIELLKKFDYERCDINWDIIAHALVGKV